MGGSPPAAAGGEGEGDASERLRPAPEREPDPESPPSNHLQPDARRPAKLSDLSDLVGGSRLLAGGGRARRPCLFERAAASWWDPRFDSDILEGQYRATTLPRIKRRLQIGLTFALLAALVWCVYVGTARERLLLALLCLLAVLPLLAVLAVTETARLERHLVAVSAVAAVALCLLSLLPAGARLTGLSAYQAVTELQLFAWAAVTVTLVYTMVPLPLYAAVATTALYSVSLETLTAAAEHEEGVGGRLLVRTGLHVCLHLIGLRTLVLAQVHMRSTFTTVGQTLLTQRQLELEKQLKEKMIHSVLPPSLADWAQDEMQDAARPPGASSAELVRPHAAPSAGPEICFRPFNMQPMDQVSILFADIVGFTRMSSNKSAAQLVGLLNDLFGRFDELCARHGCEKISTLGDCYYCVSGCPEPRDDHAVCCVEMGLSMITAIKQFDRDNGEDVNMRVGVHTGRVLCGLVGTWRFKFDVWSNDVTMANKMESSGRPGTVHISEKTYKYLGGRYTVSPGEPLSGLDTFFIEGRRESLAPQSEPSSPPGHERTAAGLLTKKACSLPSIIEPPDVSRTVEPVQQTVTLDRRSRRPPRLRAIWTDTDLKGRMCGNVRTRLAGVNPWLQPLPEERLPPPPQPDPLRRDDHGAEGPDDRLGFSLSSLNSRKDSGIRSLRSSIQAEISELNGMRPGDLMAHRASGYYTSSQSSVAEPGTEPATPPRPGECTEPPEPGDPPEPGRSVSPQQMRRKLSDLEMIKCVQTMSSHANYFTNPPIDKLTLCYENAEFERLYRHQHARRHHAATNALSLPKYNTLADTVVATLVFVAVAAAMYVTFEPRLGWVVYSALAALWLAVMQTLMWLRLTAAVARHPDREPTRFELVYSWYTRWYPFHAVGATLVSLPVGAVFANWSRAAFEADCRHSELFFLAFFVGLIHYCNFTQLNFWMKSSLATLAAVALTALLYGQPYQCPRMAAVVAGDDVAAGGAADDASDVLAAAARRRWQVFPDDLVVGLVLVVALVWILNREFEISYRLGFCVNLMAARDKAQVQRLEGQADWLLRQIIPAHVADVIKTRDSTRYSENHRDVAVVFASIINFNDLYDETYHGGREYLRVLNEIIGDMDDLLKKYPSVEKIKTIGSTYMAASGLNPSQRQAAESPDEHLVQLMEFAMDLQKAVDAFNVSLFEFAMELRIGYNFGEVTAGVIGTTKLYYDIWGDTVNTASRMDSTGVPGRIQTTQRCAERLAPYFEFERRGEVFVKGKDNMVTFFLTGRRAGDPVS